MKCLASLLLALPLLAFAQNFQNLDFESPDLPSQPDLLENSFERLFPGWVGGTTAWYDTVWDTQGFGLSDAAVDTGFVHAGKPVVLSGRFSALMVTSSCLTSNELGFQQTGFIPADAKSLRSRTTAYTLLANPGMRGDEWGIRVRLDGQPLTLMLSEISATQAVWMADITPYAGKLTSMAVSLWIDSRAKPGCSVPRFCGTALDDIEFSTEPPRALPSEKNDSIRAWGQQLDMRPLPPGASNLVMVSAGYFHKLGLRSDGKVFAWGDAMNWCTTVPDSVSNVVSVAGSHGQTYAITSGGQVLSWPSTNIATLGISNAVAVSANATFALVLRANGTVVPIGVMDRAFWSFNPEVPIPAYVPEGLSDVTAVAAGGLHGLALRKDGTVFAWVRDNSYPDGTLPPRPSKVQTNVPPSATNIIAIAAGGFHSLALRADSTVVAWGENTYGQTNVPSGLSNVIAIAAGSYHSLALRRDGTVVAWGDNDYGQTNVPPDLTNVVSISAGGNQSVAVIGSSDPAAHVEIHGFRFETNHFSLSIPTEAGRVYQLEYCGDLSASDWHRLPLVSGTGSERTLVDPNTGGVRRFYRVARW